MKIIRRLRSALWRIPVEQEVREELSHHIDLRTQELIAGGMTPDAARAEAERRFGNLHRVEAQLTTLGHARDRSLARREWLAELAQDVRFAFRQYVRRPGFTTAAIATLAIGIGAATAIFSVVHAVILRPFPFDDPDRVLLVQTTFRGNPGSWSVGGFDYLGQRVQTFDHLAALGAADFNLADAGTPERVRGARVTWNYFAVFGVGPSWGRAFTASDDQPGAPRVVILGHGLWHRRFAEDPNVVGQQVRIDGIPHEIVGVMPATFDFTSYAEDVFVPIALTAEQRANYDNFHLDLYGRRRADISLEQVNDELSRIAASLAQDQPMLNKERGAQAELVSEFFVGGYRTRLWVLLGAVTLILVIACVNVANLLLAQLVARARELAMRAALGAGRGRIVRQLLTESLVLSSVGGLAGVLLAYCMLPALIASAPTAIPRLSDAGLSGEVLAASLALTSGSTVLIGLFPAWLTSRRVSQRDELGDDRGALAGRLRPWVRHVLVGAQAGLVLIVLAGAALLVRSAIHLQAVPLGFDTSGVLNARVMLPQSQYGDFVQARSMVLAMLDNLQGATGVAVAALDSQPPLMGGGSSNLLIPEGRAMEMSSGILSRSHAITPDYFRVLRIPLTRGRFFTDRDVRPAPLVMIVSDALAREAFGDDNPVGKRMICCEGGPDDPMWKTVVGVVGDVRPRGPADPARPEFYLPLMQIPAGQWGGRTMSLVARAENGDAAALGATVRQAVAAVDPTLPLYDLRTMDEGHRRTMAQARFNTVMMSSLGLTGLLLAAIGIYSLVAWVVSQRTKEIGVRMALGAPTPRVVRHVTMQALGPVGAGLAAGMLAALAAGRALEDQLFEVSARDPLTLAAVALLMLLVASVAAFVPARRAARIDPSRALHEG